MRRAARLLARAGALLAGLAALLAAGLWAFGPYEPVARPAPFDAARLGDDPAAYLAAREKGVPDLRPAARKRIAWAGAAGARTRWSVVYLHGFSASAEEIRPVPDRVARALGANLVFTRLRGHGRDGAAMAEARAGDWLADADEALAIARAVGERVLVLSTSTGGTVAALALRAPDMRRDVAGVVFVSPNFGIDNPMAPLLTWPAARYWLPWLAGRERAFAPANAAQAAHWTTRYPSVAVMPMAALVRAARRADYGRLGIPALFYFSDADRVVVPARTHEVMARWGGPVTHVPAPRGPGVDPLAHVVAGDILSPANTGHAVAAIMDWAGTLPRP